MTKKNTRKKPIKKKTNASRGNRPADIRRVRRIVERLYFWRYHHKDDGDEVIDHLGHRGPYPPQETPEMKHSLRVQLIHTPFKWHCFTVTHCVDHWGKPYPIFGFGETPQQITVSDTLMGGLLDQTFEMAEEKANTKHIVARGVIFAPKTDTFPDILRLARKHKNDLKLSESDLEQLADWQNEPVRTVSIHDIVSDEPNDIDETIRQHYLHHEG